jgi:hypothetical protein
MSNAITTHTGAPPALNVDPRANLVAQVMAPFNDHFRHMTDLRPLFDWLPVSDLLIERANENREAAIRRVRGLPSTQDLARAGNLFEAAATDPTDELKSRVLIGLMLDGLPTAKTLASANYIDAMLDALLFEARDDVTRLTTFSPPVLAGSVRKVWRVHKFAPAITEFLSIARDERTSFWNAERWTWRLYDIRCNAEDILIETGDLTIDDDDGSLGPTAGDKTRK